MLVAVSFSSKLPPDEMSVQGSALFAVPQLTLGLGAAVNHPH